MIMWISHTYVHRELYDISKYDNIKKRGSVFCLIFPSQSVPGGVGARRPTKNWSPSSTFVLMYRQLERQSHIAEWYRRRFASNVLACMRAPCGLLCSGQVLFLSIPQLKGLSRGDYGACWQKGSRMGLVLQLRRWRGCSHLCNGLEYFLDHKILVQPKSVQICHAMGHKGGRIHLCMEILLRL